MKKLLLIVLVLISIGAVLPAASSPMPDEQMEARLSNYCTDSRFKRRRYANYCRKVWVKNEKAYCAYAADKPRYKLAFNELCGDVSAADPTKPAASGQAKKTPPAAAGDPDLETWNIVKDSNDIESIQMYLQEFPRGRFRAAAKLLIRKLQRSAGKGSAGTQPATSQTARGNLSVTSHPSNAGIYINDAYSGTSPLSVRLKPGAYKVEARKENHNNESRKIRVFEGQDLKLTLILGQKGSSLHITSTPSGADVHIDSAYSGQTPLSLKGLAPGQQMTVKIVRQGYEDWQQRVTIGSADRTLQATLNRQQTATADMVLIEAGEFPMGSEDGGSNERPVHRVYLDAYYIDKHEVTVEDYEKCVNSGACGSPSRQDTSKYGKYCNWGDQSRSNHPVNCIDWNNAVKYCEYARKQLPTEAEWEKAATWKNGRKFKYPSGKNSVSCTDAVMVNSNTWKDWETKGGCDRVSTWSVGSKPEEINGTYDMAGNVWEWVEDWYEKSYYQSSPRNNPKGPNSGSYRVIRGGSWLDNASYLRGADRGNDDPSFRRSSLGFRCARSAME